MTPDKRPLKVFLCHARADRDRVHAIYARLTKDGVDAWLDKENLLPGQDWELEIRRETWAKMFECSISMRFCIFIIGIFTFLLMACTSSTSSSSVIPEEIVDDYGVVMRLVPEGKFKMGSNFWHNEKPARSIYLKSYYIDKFEVTNEQYELCVIAGQCNHPVELSSHNRSSYFGNPDYSDYPAIFVDWYMANIYCQFRNARLPTEAEWEKAARGTVNRTYPWGKEINCSKANYFDVKKFFCVGDTVSRGSYEENRSFYGVYDMAGNVAEWVSSLDMPYPYNPADGREDLEINGDRIIRGGSWMDFEINVRTYIRFRYAPDSALNFIGIRCARDANP